MFMGGSSLVQSTLPTDNVAAAISTTSTDKVDSVCEAVKSAVQKVDADRWLDKQIYSYLCFQVNSAWPSIHG